MHENHEPIWHAQIALIFAIILQFVLSERYTIGPKYLIAGLELLLVIGIGVTTPKVSSKSTVLRRTLSLGIIVLTSIANITSLILVCEALINGSAKIDGHHLLLSALAIYLTNIIIFAIWYWEIDSPGLTGMIDHGKRQPDFLFPQMNLSSRSKVTDAWRPSFVDYLYVSITNASAFSPTDTLPMTHRSKLLMSLQSLTSLITVVLVAARAINILN